MTRVDKLKIVMLAISLTILTFLFLFRYLSVHCVSVLTRPTYLATMVKQRRTSRIFGWFRKQSPRRKYVLALLVPSIHCFIFAFSWISWSKCSRKEFCSFSPSVCFCLPDQQCNVPQWYQQWSQCHRGWRPPCVGPGGRLPADVLQRKPSDAQRAR